MKYEFDTWEELQVAMKRLSEYHDCKKCHGKIVCIGTDSNGNTICGYCKKIVKYPKLSDKAWEKEKEKFLIKIMPSRQSGNVTAC